MTETELYRHFDKDGRLLYVGVSFSSTQRWLSHRQDSEWASLSVRMEIERFSTRSEALFAEAKAIAVENPIYNKVRVMRIRTGRSKESVYDGPAAYQVVMERISAKILHVAPQPWLAKKLKVTRQIIYFWRDQGFPVKHAEKIANLLDMDPAEVCPSLLNAYLPLDIFHAIVARCTPDKPFNVVMVELIRLGLAREAAGESLPIDSETPRAQPMKAVGGFIPISAEELKTQREEAIKAGADLSVRGRRK